MVNLVKISMIREESNEKKLFAYYYNEEDARNSINAGVNTATNGKQKELRWFDAGNKCAKSSILQFQPKLFKEEGTYFLFAEDEYRPSWLCNCGKRALLVHGHSGYSCTYCGADFYINHCWSCRSPIDSRVRPRCRECGFYICICGACSDKH